MNSPFNSPVVGIVFIAMLIVVTYGLFRQSRWVELVAVYGGKAVFSCKPKRFQNVRVNEVTFSGMMTMGCDEKNLVIKPVFPISMYMKPIEEAEKQHDFYTNLYRQYSADLLKMALYVRKVITTPVIRAHLEQHHPATLGELNAIVMET